MAGNPRFTGGALEKNLRLVDQLERIAREKRASLAQIALAFVLAKGDHMAPIPGTKKLARLEENVGALGVTLTPADIAAIEKAVPVEDVAGARYATASAASLNR